MGQGWGGAGVGWGRGGQGMDGQFKEIDVTASAVAAQCLMLLLECVC